MKYVILFILVSCFGIGIHAQILSLNYSIVGDDIIGIGEFDGETTRTESDLSRVIELSNRCYDIVENKIHKQEDLFNKEISELYEHILKPFKEQIRETEVIIITLEEDLLKIPFEYFKVDDIALNTFKPLLFRLPGANFANHEIVLSLNTGTIVRNKNCDPQNACGRIKKSNANFDLFSSKDISPDHLYKAGQDILLISAHGYAYEANRGEMGWNQIPLKKELLTELSPKLTYFDSCQQGINLKYIEALQEANGINYYVAPIISNDSGDSSTKTIEWFFENIQKGLTPVSALLDTKKRLNDHYKGKKILTRLNKALSFRIYQL